MTEWAAKVLEGVPRLALETTANGEQIIVCNDGPFIRYNHAISAIAKLAEGDGLVERLSIRHGKTNAPWEDGWTYSVSDGFIVHKRGPTAMTFSLEVGLQEFVAATSANAAAHIAALTARNEWLAKVAHTATEKGMKAEARIAELVEECSQLEAMARGYAEEAAALRAKVVRLEGALGYYADQYCEGFCQDLPPGYTDENCERDCGGCKARAALTDGGK